MPMTTKEFKQLKDLLMRAGSSIVSPDTEAEAIQCFKRATLLLAKHGHTWAAALDRVVRVIDPVAGADDEWKSNEGYSRSAPHMIDPARVPKSAVQWDKLSEDQEDWDRIFEDAMADASGSFLEMLESIHAQWQEGGRLSPRQREVVKNAAERYAERHPGGRAR